MTRSLLVASNRSASRRVNSGGMCWTMKIGKGKSGGKLGMSSPSAAGPPVEIAIPTARARGRTAGADAALFRALFCGWAGKEKNWRIFGNKFTTQAAERDVERPGIRRLGHIVVRAERSASSVAAAPRSVSVLNITTRIAGYSWRTRRSTSQTVHLRHFDVESDHVRIRLRNALKRDRTVCSDAHNLDVRIFLEHVADQPPDDHGVVHHQDANALTRAGSRACEWRPSSFLLGETGQPEFVDQDFFREGLHDVFVSAGVQRAPTSVRTRPRWSP